MTQIVYQPLTSITARPDGLWTDHAIARWMRGNGLTSVLAIRHSLTEHRRRSGATSPAIETAPPFMGRPRVLRGTLQAARRRGIGNLDTLPVSTADTAEDGAILCLSPEAFVRLSLKGDTVEEVGVDSPDPEIFPDDMWIFLDGLASPEGYPCRPTGQGTGLYLASVGTKHGQTFRGRCALVSFHIAHPVPGGVLVVPPLPPEATEYRVAQAQTPIWDVPAAPSLESLQGIGEKTAVAALQYPKDAYEMSYFASGPRVDLLRALTSAAA